MPISFEAKKQEILEKRINQKSLKEMDEYLYELFVDKKDGSLSFSKKD